MLLPPGTDLQQLSTHHEQVGHLALQGMELCVNMWGVRVGAPQDLKGPIRVHTAAV